MRNSEGTGNKMCEQINEINLKSSAHGTHTHDIQNSQDATTAQTHAHTYIVCRKQYIMTSDRQT